MKWVKEQPQSDGIYWVKVSGYGTLYPHGDNEREMIVELSYSEVDNIWTVMELGGDCMFDVADDLGIEYWSDIPIEKPQ